MKRTLLIILGVVAVLAIGAYIFLRTTLKNTKKSSPEQTITYKENGADVSVFYCRPSKKGRVIFGSLVPYGQWWRTGANEPTTIETSKDLNFNGQTLKAGKYHLVTIPEEKEWTIVFNKEIPFWGTEYDPTNDVLRVKALVQNAPEAMELFTIAFQKAGDQDAIAFQWDQTKVALPFAVQ